LLAAACHRPVTRTPHSSQRGDRSARPGLRHGESAASKRPHYDLPRIGEKDALRACLLMHGSAANPSVVSAGRPRQGSLRKSDRRWSISGPSISPPRTSQKACDARGGCPHDEGDRACRTARLTHPIDRTTENARNNLQCAAGYRQPWQSRFWRARGLPATPCAWVTSMSC